MFYNIYILILLHINPMTHLLMRTKGKERVERKREKTWGARKGTTKRK
jgi:hypothetical protein